MTRNVPVYRMPSWFGWYFILFVLAGLWVGCNALKKSAAPVGMGAAAGGIVMLLIPGGAIVAIPAAALTAHLTNEVQDAGDVEETVARAMASTTRELAPWWMNWKLWAAGIFAFYRRAPLMRALRTGGSPKALALNLWSALWASEKAADRSKAATRMHRENLEGRKLRKAVEFT